MFPLVLKDKNGIIIVFPNICNEIVESRYQLQLYKHCTSLHSPSYHKTTNNYIATIIAIKIPIVLFTNYSRVIRM